MASNANLGGVVDPRLGDESEYIGTRRDSTVKQELPVAPPDTHGHNTIYLDPTISFEAYNFWAQRAREEEKNFVTESAIKQAAKILSGKKLEGDNHPHGEPDVSPASEKPAIEATAEATGTDRWGITSTEWERANRQTRTATWITIFYLITTDILGPYNVPWAISRMGYGPGIALYVVFGGMAFYSGLQLWWQFMGLDSPRYPMRNYGDLAFRVYGGWFRQVVNVLQSLQFFLNVTLLIESNGQGLQQMAAGPNGTGVLCCKFE